MVIKPIEWASSLFIGAKLVGTLTVFYSECAVIINHEKLFAQRENNEEKMRNQALSFNI